MVGERLYDFRKDAGLTQEALVKILNTTKHAISKYECEQAEPPDSPIPRPLTPPNRFCRCQKIFL